MMDIVEAAKKLPEGDLYIEVELVTSGWIAYVRIYPEHGPIVSVGRSSIYARTSPHRTRGEALAALPEAFATILALKERAE